MRDCRPYLLNFASLVDASDWLLAKGGDGAISVKLLKGWIWDDSNLTAHEDRTRFATLKEMVARFILDFPGKFEIVNDVSFDDENSVVYAKMKVCGVGMNRDELHEYAKRTFGNNESNKPWDATGDNVPS